MSEAIHIRFTEQRVAFRYRQTRSMMALVEDLVALSWLDPALVESELRPLVERLKARSRACAGCSVRYLQKRRHVRRRTFCESCRNGGRRPKGLDAASPRS